jgi:diguanylate cyclase (GGDEF)-like protein
LEAEKQFNYFIGLMLFLAITITALSTGGLHFMVLRRLKQIDDYLKQVDILTGNVKKITIAGNDELSQVATTVNQLLNRISVDRQQIEQINRQLQEELAERTRTEQVLQYSSEHDVLTGLYNRRYFETALARVRQTGAVGVGVICCDLDGLKLVNDTFGHAAGDIMLQRTAAMLRRLLPESALIARVGGDEFIALLAAVDESLLQQVYKHCNDSKESGAKASQEFPLQISVGYRFRSQCQPGSKELDQMLKEADDEMYRQKLSSTHSNRNVVVQTIMKMLEMRDYATEGHSQRMGDLAVALAEQIGLANNSKNDLRLLAQFHDLGKIGVPDQILLKPGPLTAEERKEMERHSEIGHRIAMVVPEFLPVADLILKHHEWWNGTGYPLGLQGESIPVENRILSIVDAYDAMTSDRPYRAAMTQGAAIEELRRCRGNQFDPVLVDEFIALLAVGTSQRVDFE